MKKGIYKLLSISVLFLYSCAGQQIPQGGPLDQTPPTLIFSSIPNKAINFSGNSITFTFDEFIRIDNPGDVFVSPLMLKKPEISVKGKSITVYFKDSLAPNSTYVLDFGSQIKDNKEGTAVDGFTFTFSTGKNVDTLEINGNVTDAFSLEPTENVWVMLYPFLKDSVQLFKKPSYIAKTDKNGNFTILGLPSKPFRVVALADANRNFKIDPFESVAFFSEPVTPGADSLALQLKTFKNIPPVNTLLNSSSLNPFTFFFYLGNLSQNLKHDTVSYDLYFKNLQKVSKDIYFPSWNADTLFIQFYKSTTDSFFFKYNDYTSKLHITSNKGFIPEIKETKDLGFNIATSSFYFSHNCPSCLADTTKLEVWVDSMLVQKENYNIKITENGVIVYAKNEWGENKTYQIKIKRGFLIHADSVFNKPKTFQKEVTPEKKLGSVSLTLNGDSTTSYIVYLIKGNDVISKHTVSIKEEIYLVLPSGNYSLRIISDSDKNMLWSGGNLKNLIQPEKVLFLSNYITVKANWENKLTVEIP